MRLATITKELIEKSIEEDQGTKYRASIQKILPKIEDAYRESSDGFRSHLGVSLIGRSCSFELYLGFRWVQKAWFPERVLRLFNRGHLEEAHFIAMLESADIPCWYETKDGGQFRISDHGGHMGSALDAVVKIPELGEAPAYGEFKTHNDKSFKKVVKEGVQNSKYEHYVQMQVCMHKQDLKFGVYFAVNKNDDHIHIEIIEYDKQVATSYLKRGGNIIFAREAMPTISNRASWYECKFCNMHGLCYDKQKPEINCRTCFNSIPLADGTWSCNLPAYEETVGTRTIEKDFMKIGCQHHLYNPHLIRSVDLIKHNREENYVELRLESGKIIKQGPNHIRSGELEL